MTVGRKRYRFVGRRGDRYVWQASIDGDSRVHEVSCRIAWFWSSPTIEHLLTWVEPKGFVGS